MNKRMRELLAAIEQKQKEARAFMDGENKDVEKATALLDECDKLVAEYNAEKRLFDAEKANIEPEATENAASKKTEDTVKAFAKAARSGFTAKDMSEGVDSAGGYTVPEDIVTRIERYRDAKFSLRSLVRVVPVKTNTGARTFKSRMTRTGFSKVLENGKFESKATPTFERISYTIDKFGGYFVMSDEIVEDSDENVVNLIVEDIGDESRITDNREILSVINTNVSATNLTDLDGIKTALNITLGQAFAPTSVIVTNDNGLDYLDKLYDGNGRPLLKVDPTDTLKKWVTVGFNVVPLCIVPNTDLPNKTINTSGDGIPFLIGDLTEAVVLWDRRAITLLQSNVASVGSGATAYNAFEQGGRIVRADMRADYTMRDETAIVNGYIIPD